MDSVAIRFARLKREAQREWKRKWRKKVRQAAPANAAEWRALAGAIAGAVMQVALIISLPFAGLVRGSVVFHEHSGTPGMLCAPHAGIHAGGAKRPHSG